MFTPSFNKVFVAVCLLITAIAHPLEEALVESHALTPTAGSPVPNATMGAGGTSHVVVPVPTSTLGSGGTSHVTSGYPVPTMTLSAGGPSQVCPPFTYSPITVTSWIPRPTANATLGLTQVTREVTGYYTSVTNGTTTAIPTTSIVNVTAGGGPISMTVGDGPVCACPYGPQPNVTALPTISVNGTSV